jgi:hypothetical protein
VKNLALNKAYLTAGRTASSDEVFTPFYAVEPLMKYIPKDKVIWMPFDEEWSAYYQLFTENGYKCIRSSIREGQDFFTYEPAEHYDIIISNPPFSKKDKVLKRLNELNKPFAILLPANSLQGKARYQNCFKNGIQYLGFDARVDYHTNFNFDTYTKGNHFASAYFCRNILPKDLIIDELVQYERKLI